jgi:hypothetical protein
VNPEQILIDALHAIEVQHAGLPGSDPAQAEQAKAAILARCRQAATAADVAEFRFTLADPWSQLLFHAILKRYDLRAYRYQGQRKSTIMVRASKRLIDEVLTPLLHAMSQRLNEYFADVARWVLPVALSPAPYHLAVLPNHEHAHGQLCPECAKKVGVQTPVAEEAGQTSGSAMPPGG